MSDAIEARLRRVERRAPSAHVRVTPKQPQNVIDFATSPQFLDQRLSPRQALLLKVITFAFDLLTAYDLSVIARWTEAWAEEHDADTHRWTGSYGVPPDLVDRVRAGQKAGLPWFNELALILGRRAGKGFLIRILVAWAIWRLITMDDPQAHYGVDGNKALNLLVFSTKIEQAKRDVFADVRLLLLSAPCFKPYVGKHTTDRVELWTPRQLNSTTWSSTDEGLIVVRAAESTESASRGAASPVLVLDEAAHIIGAGSTADANTILRAGEPATAQFREDRLVILASTPADKTGPLHRSYQRALQINPDTGTGAHPETFAVQLPSWDLFVDWERADQIEMWPDGPCFKRLERSILDEDDDEVVKLRQVDHETYLVEYEAQWRTSKAAYMTPFVIERIFGSVRDQLLEMQTRGRLGYVYMAHADPSVSGANFGFAIGHLEQAEDEPHPHVFFDVLHYWDPRDFDHGIVDYPEIERQLLNYIQAFGISRLTFDQFNSANSIQRLQRDANSLQLPKRCQVFKVDATATTNWNKAEIFKTAASLGLVHAPPHALARLELEHLERINNRVDHPQAGDVRTKDIADCMIEVNYALLEEGAPELFAMLAGLVPRGSQPGGFRPSNSSPLTSSVMPEEHRALSNFGRSVTRRHRPGKQGG